MCLRNDQEVEFELTHYSWRRALRMATRYGWDPGSRDWFARSGQRVDEATARELAAALERALPDVPRHDAMEDLRCELGKVPDQAWFSGPRRETLTGFVRFCRAGEFRIL